MASFEEPLIGCESLRRQRQYCECALSDMCLGFVAAVAHTCSKHPDELYLERRQPAFEGANGVRSQDEEPTTSDREGATVLQATFNLINIYVGLGLLSQAYALRLSGWLGLVALAATTGLFCLSGKLLIRAFEALPPGIAQTYPNLGIAALGCTGKYIVASFTILEFFCGSCITLLVIWRELIELLPDQGVGDLSAFHIAVFGTFICVLPIIFVPSFKKLSWLNLAGCLSTVLVTLAMVLSVAVDADRSRLPSQPPPGHDVARLGIFQAVGIFALSVSGHSSLPVLRKTMRRPQDFDAVLSLAFSAMLVLYGVVAACGYYYWGASAHALVTTDLKTNSPLSGASLLLPGLTPARLVSGCILVNAATTYPSLLMVIQDMVFSVTPLGSSGTGKPVYLTGAALRVAIFFGGTVLSCLAYSVLGNIMSLSGGFCSISCSLLVPSLFFLLLHRRRVSVAQALAVASMLGLGLALLVLSTSENVLDIARQRHAAAMHPAGPAHGLHAGSLWLA